MLRAVIDQFPYCVIWKGCHFRYLGCNKAFATACGGGLPEDLIGHTDADFCTPGIATLRGCEDEDVLENGRTLVLTEPFVPVPTREPILMEKIKLPLRSEAGEIIGVIDIAIDVIERRRAEEQLTRPSRRRSERMPSGHG